MINLSVLSVYEFFLITAALIMALWRRTTLSVSLVLLLLISHIGLAIFAGDVVAPQYLVPLSLVYTLLIAGLFQKFASLKWIGAAFFLSIGLGYTIAVPLSHVFQRDPVQLPVLPAATWVRDNVRPDETVVADSFYFVFLTDYTFFSPDTPGYIHLGYRPALEEAAAQIDVSAFADSVANLTPNALRYRTVVWDEISPDVVVIDPNLSSCCIAPIALPAYLESRGYRLVAQFDGETQPVLIYRKNSS